MSEKDARRCKQMGKGSRATARRAKRRPPVTCLTALSAGRGAAAANPCMSRGGSGRSGSGASVRRTTGPTGRRPSRRSRRRGRGTIRWHTIRRVRHGAVRRHHDRLAVRWPHANRGIRRDEHLRGWGGARVSAGGREGWGGGRAAHHRLLQHVGLPLHHRHGRPSRKHRATRPHRPGHHRDHRGRASRRRIRYHHRPARRCARARRLPQDLVHLQQIR